MYLIYLLFIRTEFVKILFVFSKPLFTNKDIKMVLVVSVMAGQWY